MSLMKFILNSYSNPHIHFLTGIKLMVTYIFLHDDSLSIFFVCLNNLHNVKEAVDIPYEHYSIYIGPNSQSVLAD